MFQIKTFLYFPPAKADERGLRDGIDKFFDSINKWLVDKKLDSTDIMVSDSNDYIFIHIVHKVKNLGLKKRPSTNKKKKKNKK